MYDGFYKNCLSKLVCDGFFMRIAYFRIIFSMKRGYAYVWETCEFCGYIAAFKIIVSIKRDHESIFRFVSILF